VLFIESRMAHKRFIALVGAVTFFYGAAAPSTRAQSNQFSHALQPVCAACHGANGNAQVPGMPSLAGQPKIFLENQLVLIREGLREVPQMKGLLDKLTDEEITAFAKYYSALPVKSSLAQVDDEKYKRAEQLSQKALCSSCHQADFSGKEQMPRLAGQREDFLLLNMKQFRDGQTTGRDTMMSGILRGMTDAQLNDLAHYFAAYPGR
jgi:cytochrome c553